MLRPCTAWTGHTDTIMLQQLAACHLLMLHRQHLLLLLRMAAGPAVSEHRRLCSSYNATACEPAPTAMRAAATPAPWLARGAAEAHSSRPAAHCMLLPWEPTSSTVLRTCAACCATQSTSQTTAVLPQIAPVRSQCPPQAGSLAQRPESPVSPCWCPLPQQPPLSGVHQQTEP